MFDFIHIKFLKQLNFPIRIVKIYLLTYKYYKNTLKFKQPCFFLEKENVFIKISENLSWKKFKRDEHVAKNVRYVAEKL